LTLDATIAITYGKSVGSSSKMEGYWCLLLTRNCIRTWIESILVCADQVVAVPDKFTDLAVKSCKAGPECV
jgi:hypothetical protein